MIETYCDACGVRLEDAHESDVMVYFRYTPDAYVDMVYHFCPTCSINMRGELQNMIDDVEKAKRGKHGKS